MPIASRMAAVRPLRPPSAATQPACPAALACPAAAAVAWSVRTAVGWLLDIAMGWLPDGLAGAGPAGPAGPAGGVAATIVPGVSMATNRYQAADQPSGVGGHHSIGCGCGELPAQIP